MTTSINNVIKTANKIRPQITDELKLTARPMVDYLIDKYNVSFYTYDEIKQGCAIGDFSVYQLIKSSDAATIYDQKTNSYSLIYNSNMYPKARKVWSIYHEAGHIILGHLKLLDSNPNLVGDKFLELQANTFALEMLAPSTLIYAAISKFISRTATVDDLFFMYKYAFGLSRGASALASKILHQTHISFDKNLIMHYQDKLTHLFPYITSSRDYEDMIHTAILTNFNGRSISPMTHVIDF